MPQRSDERNLILTGVTGCRNRGVEALVRSTVQEVGRVDPSLKITVLSSDPDYDGWVLADSATVVDDAAASFRGGRRRAVRARLARVHRRFDVPYRTVTDAFASASLVLASGGDIFGSDYGAAFLRRHVATVRTAQQAGKPSAFLAQSIGPFRDTAQLELWRAVALSADLVSVRERRSYDYVTAAVGIPEDKVILMADPAFLLRPASDERVDRLLQTLGVDGQTPMVAIAPSQGIHGFAGLDEQTHLRVWRETAERLTSYGAQVLIIPHVQDNKLSNDDRVLCTQLSIACAALPNVHALIGEFRAADYKGVIARCDMVVAERTHASIAGLSSSVATLSVGYSVKAEGITSAVFEGHPDLALLLSISAHDFVSGTSLLPERLDAIWRQRAEIADVLRSGSDGVRRAATEGFQRLLALA